MLKGQVGCHGKAGSLRKGLHPTQQLPPHRSAGWGQVRCHCSTTVGHKWRTRSGVWMPVLHRHSICAGDPCPAEAGREQTVTSYHTASQLTQLLAAFVYADALLQLSGHPFAGQAGGAKRGESRRGGGSRHAPKVTCHAGPTRCCKGSMIRGRRGGAILAAGFPVVHVAPNLQTGHPRT